MSATRVHLERYETGPLGTFGKLWISGAYVLDSLELHTVEAPWEDNRRGVSCIPTGEYKLIRGKFYKGGYSTFELDGVPGRSLIKIHVANFARELTGCIALGMTRGTLGKTPAVLHSREAHDLLMDSLAGLDATYIEITEDLR